MQNYSGHSHVNAGTGEDVTIAELAQMIMSVAGFAGAIDLDRSKPDGTPRKLMDSSKLRGPGWHPRIGLDAGLPETYEWYVNLASP